MPIMIDMEITVAKHIPSLVVGFNLYSSFAYPLARADYNDESKLKTLAPGKYQIAFTIPAYTLSDGTYTLKFDVAERNLCNYASEKSHLTFTVIHGADNFGNIFSENMPIKSSIIREKWLTSINRIK